MSNEALTFDHKTQLLPVDRTQPTDYDNFSWIYDKYWANDFALKIKPIIQKYVLSSIKNNANILDLCCGSGTVSRLLSEEGHIVTGIDYSAAMLKLAKERVPNGSFHQMEITNFSFDTRFSGAFCCYDSMNYLMTEEALLQTCQNVYNHLLPDGLFFFDMNLKEAYLKKAGAYFNINEADHVCCMVSHLDEQNSISQVQASLFLFKKTWERSDFLLTQKYYPLERILQILRQSGFDNVEFYDGRSELNLDVCVGKYFFICKKQGIENEQKISINSGNANA